MGAPERSERARLVGPYYRSSYVLVQRRGGRAIRSLDDPRLRSARVGVQLVGDDGAMTPPGHALARRGIVDNLVGFMIGGDHGRPDPEERIVRAVERGEIDVAAVWGPLAGYYAARAAAPLEIHRLADEEAMPMTFGVGLAVRKDDRELAATLAKVLARRAAEIARILDRFGVPRASR